MQDSQGVTFLELLISMVLSIVLIGGFLSCYRLVQKNLQSQMDITQWIEHRKLLQEILGDLIHSSAYKGDGNVSIFELKPYLNPDKKLNTDGFMIRYVGGDRGELVDDMEYNDRIDLMLNIDVTHSSHLIISDGMDYEFLSIKKTIQCSGFQKIYLKKNLSKLYKKFSKIIELNSEAYFIANTHRISRNHQPIYALFKKKEGHDKEELIENISDIKIKIFVMENQQIIEKRLSTIYNDSNLVGITFKVKHETSAHDQEIHVAFRKE